MAPAIDRGELAAEYGWSLAFLNSNPELKALFNHAVAGTWTPTKFVAELRSTDWFKSHSASFRAYLVNKTVDPASFQADFDRTHAMIADAYGSLWGTQLPPGLADSWTRRAMMFGWSDAQIKDHIIGAMHAQHQIFKSNVGGQAAQLKDQIQNAIGAYGVQPSNPWIAEKIKQIMLGNTTADGAIDQIRTWAEKRYSAYADQIRGGKTVADIADPYVQTMSQLLELAPGQVDIQNKYIQQALTRTVQDKKRQTSQVPMSMTAFGDMMRADPRWMRTQQAKDQFSQAASHLLTSWGLV